MWLLSLFNDSNLICLCSRDSWTGEDVVRQPAQWMQLPIDERILEALDSSGMILSPAVIAMNIEKSRDEVNRRLSILVEHSLVSRVQRGYYEITDLGERYLSGEFNPSDSQHSTDSK